MHWIAALVVSAAVSQAEPIALDKVNSPSDDTDPYVATNNAALLFSSNRNSQFEIFLTKRGSLTVPWPAATVFSSLRDADMRGPFFLKEFVYFASNVTQGDENAKLRNFDLYRRLDQGAPIPLLGVCEREDEARPWITAGGSEFYFSRKMKDGWTQFVANGPTPGPIGKPREIGFGPGFSHACVAASGLTMFLQGPVEGEGDRLGIYRSTRVRPNAAWTKPQPITKLNHPDAKRGDMAPCISSDGLRLYFASDRPGGKGGLDLWVIPLDKLK